MSISIDEFYFGVVGAIIMGTITITLAMAVINNSIRELMREVKNDKNR